MADPQWPFLSLFSQTIGRFTNDPVTNWQRFFNPQFIFNYNPQDVGVEQHVLSEVGSYGSQLSTLIDAIDVLRSSADETKWTAEDHKSMDAFIHLKTKADLAVKQYRGTDGFNGIISAIKAVERNNPKDFDQLKRKLSVILNEPISKETSP